LPKRLQYNCSDSIVDQFQLAFAENEIVEDKVADPVELASFEAHLVLIPLLKIVLLGLPFISEVGQKELSRVGARIGCVPKSTDL
jgi:hypothetical protein